MVLSRFEKFLKSEQFKMICSILLILFLSLLIKMTMPDSFEHLQQEIVFTLKFKEAPAELSNFNFSVKTSSGDKEGTIESTVVNFSDVLVSDLEIKKVNNIDYIQLEITSDEYKNIELSDSTDKIVKESENIFNIPKDLISGNGESSNITLKADPN